MGHSWVHLGIHVHSKSDNSIDPYKWQVKASFAKNLELLAADSSDDDDISAADNFMVGSSKSAEIKGKQYRPNFLQ